MKPQPIDSFKDTNTGINGIWGMALPYGYGDGLQERILHAWWVLTGKARAVIFLTDYVKKILPKKKHLSDQDRILAGMPPEHINCRCSMREAVDETK